MRMVKIGVDTKAKRRDQKGVSLNADEMVSGPGEKRSEEEVEIH